MSLTKELRTAICASQSGIRLNTDEIADALATISKLCQKYSWEMRVWDRSLGLQSESTEAEKALADLKPKSNLPAGLAEMSSAPKAMSGLEAIARLLTERSKHKKSEDEEDDEIPVLLVMKNFHLLFEKSREEGVALVQHFIEHGKSNGKFIVGLMPHEVRLPPEVEPLFHVIDHDLPDEKELLALLDSMGEETMADHDRAMIAKAALGLTRLQAEGVFAASRVQSGDKVNSPYVWAQKAKILNREGLVELHETNTNFGNVGGLHGFKDFLKRLMEHDDLEDEDPDARYKGVVAVGPAGVGKSLMAYCVGNEFKIPTLKANPANLMDQYVGNTEKNTRKFFQICRRMAPCVVVIDEVSQVMPSGGDGGDSGVSKRLLGTFLTQLNDIQEPILWFFTSNDVENMHEAFLRAERIDAKIYVRLPDAMQRSEIWKIYIKKFFPRDVKGQPDKRHIELDLKKAIKEYGEAKKVSPVESGSRIGAAMMTVRGDLRTKYLEQIEKVDVNLLQSVKANLFDDENWTPAEIRSCCRLARRLKLSLFETSKRIGHVCIGRRGEKTLQRLDRWAESEGALDAETGKLFHIEEDEVADDEPSKPRKKKVRRTVRRLDD